MLPALSSSPPWPVSQTSSFKGLAAADHIPRDVGMTRICNVLMPISSFLKQDHSRKSLKMQKIFTKLGVKEIIM